MCLVAIVCASVRSAADAGAGAVASSQDAASSIASASADVDAAPSAVPLADAAPTPTAVPLIAARVIDPWALPLSSATPGSLFTAYGGSVYRTLEAEELNRYGPFIAYTARTWIRRRMATSQAMPPTTSAAEGSSADAGAAAGSPGPSHIFQVESYAGAEILHSDSGAEPSSIVFPVPARSGASGSGGGATEKATEAGNQAAGVADGGSSAGVGDLVTVSVTPRYGRMFWISLLVNTSSSSATTTTTITRHNLTISIGVPHSEATVSSHTWTIVADNNAVAGGDGVDVAATFEVSADGTVAAPSPATAVGNEASSKLPLTLMSYNVWNSNPPKWLYRDPRDRYRQYTLRLHHLTDVVRMAASEVITFQEVRYDSSLGGYDEVDGSGDAAAAAAAVVDVNAPAPLTLQRFEALLVAARAKVAPSDANNGPSTTADAPSDSGIIVDVDAAIDALIEPADEAFAEPPKIERNLPYTNRMAWGIGSLWYNKTCSFADNGRYKDRNKAKWDGVTSARGWDLFGSMHPIEGDVAVQRDLAAAEAAGVKQPAEQVKLDVHGNIPVPTPLPRGKSPFEHPSIHTRGPASFNPIQRAMLAQPHSQIAHLASHLPGYQFVHNPAQVYLDRDALQASVSSSGVGGDGRADGSSSVIVDSSHRDEEGPAIFSRWPIIASDYILLSRNPGDDGDGHQRLCLHAVVDATGALTAKKRQSLRASNTAGSGNDGSDQGRLLIDVYTVHLALSEAARNRTILEIMAFISSSSRGHIAVITGDMNAEPHEWAMQRLQRSGSGSDGPTASPAPAAAAEAAAASTADAEPTLRDVWLALGRPEPTPRDSDASTRRYAFTFPSDDPVKRIDMVYAGWSRSGSGLPLCATGTAPSSTASGSGSTSTAGAHNDSSSSNHCIAIDDVYLLGQDALPGT